MEENYGKIVSNIRIAKGVPIGKLISGICSRTAYRNFVMNRTGTSVDNFMKLLAKLHVSYTEFKYIANGFETNYEQRYVIDLQKAIAQGDLKRLDDLLQRTLNYCAIYENDEKYRHLACITQLTIDKVKRVPLDEDARQVVIDYLIECETWTHYELMMFNNAMFAFSFDQIRMFREKVIHNLEKYQNLRIYGSESFRVLINMLMVFIENQSYQDIRIMMGLINNYQLNEDMLFEETLRLYFTGILDLINQKIPAGLTKVKQALEVLSILNAKDYYQNLKQYLEQIILKYDLDIKV
ncbi:hypothetical protein [Ligilactobacillus araffinosus]|uniref:HTH-type transcriptional regulator Rgg C-terminal domain-containing protein n=1 Tax=Ligilactobacillus araffinosus DSM 20653 TaxID=1423820 RepID=A0A0R1ZGB8_9LACO|nr:hypothetical protein [Ligilactobacillus araffinosus]KRM53234.1 hypothetical protein FC64_GL000805 [Ligilactobacillus araffinosus DSM 20653]